MAGNADTVRHRVKGPFNPPTARSQPRAAGPAPHSRRLPSPELTPRRLDCAWALDDQSQQTRENGRRTSSPAPLFACDPGRSASEGVFRCEPRPPLIPSPCTSAGEHGPSSAASAAAMGRRRTWRLSAARCAAARSGISASGAPGASSRQRGALGAGRVLVLEREPSSDAADRGRRGGGHPLSLRAPHDAKRTRPCSTPRSSPRSTR